MNGNSQALALSMPRLHLASQVVHYEGVCHCASKGRQRAQVSKETAVHRQQAYARAIIHS